MIILDFTSFYSEWLPIIIFVIYLIANFPFIRYFFFNKIRIKMRGNFVFIVIYFVIYLFNNIIFSVIFQNSYSFLVLIITNILFSINLINIIIRKSIEIPLLKLKPIDKMYFKQGNIVLGYHITSNMDYHLFKMKLEDIKRHILIYGQTGSGKTTFVKQFLLNFSEKYPQIKFILFEFKGEYLDLEKSIPDTKVLIPGENFTINLFENNLFPKEILPELIFDSFKSCQILDLNAEFSPQMEYVLINILKDLILKNSDKTWSNFFKKMDEYVLRKENQNPQIIQTSIGIKNRLRRYSEGPLKKIFTDQNSINSTSELFNHNYIIDLGNIIKIGGNKEDIIFFSNLILKIIWHYNVNKKPTTNLDHITIFEDCSYLASKKVLELSKLTSYLEDIALLLRGKGESLITITTTLDISKNIILNSGSKFFFKFNEKPDDIVHHLGLKSDTQLELASLNTGLCIAKIDSIPYPFLMYIEKSICKPKKNPIISDYVPSKEISSYATDYEMINQQNDSMKLTISIFYFNNIEGEVCYFKKGNLDISDQLENQLSQLIEKRFSNCSINMDGNQHFIFHFEIKSLWARGGTESVSIIVSLIDLKPISQNLQEIISNFTHSAIESLQSNSDCYKGFYISDSQRRVQNKKEIEKNSIFIKKVIKDTYDKIQIIDNHVSNSRFNAIKPSIEEKIKDTNQDLNYIIDNLIRIEKNQPYKN